MISLFSRLTDGLVERQFGKDPNGRLVFLPFGPKGKCYFVDSKSDEEKIRAFVRMYRSASTLISLLTSPSIVVPAVLLEDYSGLTHRAHRWAIALGIPAFFWLVLILVALVVWAAYKANVPSLTSSLTEVGPDMKDQLSPASPPSQFQRRVAIVALLAGALLVGGTFLSISQARAVPHSSGATCPAPTVEK
jgi:hypothetical protein